MTSGPCARFSVGQEDYGDWNWIEFLVAGQERKISIPRALDPSHIGQYYAVPSSMYTPRSRDESHLEAQKNLANTLIG